MKPQIQAFISATMIFIAGAALALDRGVDPALSGPIVNPATGQETDVWKLVGRFTGACSGVQISRRWVLTAGHCDYIFALDSAKTTFTNYLGSSHFVAASRAGCRPPSERDFCLVRLTEPENFEEPTSYPPLVAGPQPKWSPYSAEYYFPMEYASQYGQLMVFGRGVYDLVSFVTYSGLPINFDPAVDPTGNTIPHTLGNDSGGGVYWFSPTSLQSAFAGVLSTFGTAPSTPTLLTADELTWIRQTLLTSGDAPPVALLASQHYAGPQGDLPPELDAPPHFEGSGLNWIVKWETPATGDVTSYEITVGRNEGVLDRRILVGAGEGNSVALDDLTATRYIVCTRPINVYGAARAIKSLLIKADTAGTRKSFIETPNCNTLDLRTPASIGPLSFTPMYDSYAGTYKVTATWVSPDVVPTKYRVVRTIRYASVSRKTITEVTDPSLLTSNVVKGSTVCLSVTGISRAGVAGPTSQTQCQLVN